jgi:hypothetical protein
MSQTIVPTFKPTFPGGETIGSSNLVANGVEEKASFRLPSWVWMLSGAVALWGIFSPNPMLTPAAVVILVISTQLLWRYGEPPVLAFASAMQWLQAAALIFYTDFYGLSVAQAGGSIELETATWLSLIAVLVLSLGMRCALTGCKRSQHTALVADALRVDIGKAFVAYLISFVIAGVAERVAFSVPAVTQLIAAFVTLKWLTIFIIGYAIIEQRGGYIFLGSIVLIEIVVGSLGFFSGFKSVFFVLLVVALSSPLAFRGRRLAITFAITVALSCFGVVWSAIKADYREYLNQGSEQQIVAVSAEESADKLTDLLGNVSWESLTNGLDSMILRVSYTNYFALTLINVPDNVPYEHGALWLGALKHIVTPRLFFPEKASLSDSDRTTLYTGIQVAGESRGTSIGIGYVAESYVDFGPIWMFGPIFLLGMFYGLIYRVFIIRSRSKLICTAIAGPILIFGAYTIETSNAKIVGGIVTALLVLSTVYLFFGRAFQTWLEGRE